MNRSLQASLALSLVLLASPALAQSDGGLDLTLHAGYDKYDAVGLRSGLGGLHGSSLLDGGSRTLGVTAIFRSGMGELGAIGEVGRIGQDGTTTLLGVLLGPGFDLGGARLELLGELGAHQYGNVLHDAAVVSQSKNEAWLVSVGLRPGLSFRLGSSHSMILGVWTFARWDLTSQDVQVNLAGSGNSTYTLGGSQYGASLRFGFSL